MVDTNALRGIIVSRGLTNGKVAKHLGMNPKTFGEKMKKRVFGSDEMEAMIELLSIEDPIRIFFAKEVTSEVTIEGEAQEKK